MFNKLEKETGQDHSNSSNIIGKGTIIEGGLETAGNLRVEGRINGDVKCKSKIVIGQTAYIDGNLMSVNVEVAGEVKGFMKVSGLLTLKASAVVHGDIVAKELVIEPGAKFDGQCRMSDNVKELELMQPKSGLKIDEDDKHRVMPLKKQLRAMDA